MIKINLLPVRAAKRKEAARQHVIILIGSLIIVVLIAFSVFSYLLVKISATKDEIDRSEQELVELKAKIGKINDLEKLKAEVNKKLDVLEQLRKGRTGPAKRLLTLGQATPEKLWLTDYDEKDMNATLSGVAFNEELIATLMKNLEASPEFSNVELVVSEQVEMASMKLKKFQLRFNIESLLKNETVKTKNVGKKKT
jgi:type IV pilus assembly protein PilN